MFGWVNTGKNKNYKNVCVETCTKKTYKLFCFEVMTELQTLLLKTVYIYTLDCLSCADIICSFTHFA